MKLLVDQNLPPRLAVLLTEHGHDAVHVRAIVDLPPDQLADLLAERLPALADNLDRGAAVAMTPRGARVRRLPMR